MSCCTPHSAAEAQAAPAKSSAAASALVPEFIEIEPVVGREAAIVLEAPGVALQQGPDQGLARRSGEVLRGAKLLEADFVAIAAEVEAEHQHDGTVQHRRD